MKALVADLVACSAQAARTLVPEPTVERKTCTKCKHNKAAADFFKFKFSSDGLQSYCKVRYDIGVFTEP